MQRERGEDIVVFLSAFVFSPHHTILQAVANNVMPFFILGHYEG